MITGPEIKAARKRAGMTQQQLATAVGVVLRTVGNWERGETVPRDRESIVFEVLRDHLGRVESDSPRLRVASDEELMFEVQRRFTLYKEEASGHVAPSAQKTNDESNVTHLPPPPAVDLTEDEAARRDRDKKKRKPPTNQSEKP